MTTIVSLSTMVAQVSSLLAPASIARLPAEQHTGASQPAICAKVCHLIIGGTIGLSRFEDLSQLPESFRCEALCRALEQQRTLSTLVKSIIQPGLIHYSPNMVPTGSLHPLSLTGSHQFRQPACLRRDEFRRIDPRASAASPAPATQAASTHTGPPKQPQTHRCYTLQARIQREPRAVDAPS